MSGCICARRVKAPAERGTAGQSAHRQDTASRALLVVETGIEPTAVPDIAASESTWLMLSDIPAIDGWPLLTGLKVELVLATASDPDTRSITARLHARGASRVQAYRVAGGTA